jgi:2,3-bisphosphoglycerate-independent phosphoglycerate mutase
MAETEKYPHVTWFLNGGDEVPYDGESRIMVPSPKVATYDLQPEMSAPDLAALAVAAIVEGRQDLIVLNFANADMVGHTGSLPPPSPPARRWMRPRRHRRGHPGGGRHAAGDADHGNAEQMRDPLTGQPHTAHTTNRVPVLLMGGPAGAALHDGRLADVAPTLLALLGVAQPAAMTGRSLLERPGLA